MSVEEPTHSQLAGIYKLLLVKHPDADVPHYCPCALVHRLVYDHVRKCVEVRPNICCARMAHLSCCTATKFMSSLQRVAQTSACTHLAFSSVRKRWTRVRWFRSHGPEIQCLSYAFPHEHA